MSICATPPDDDREIRARMQEGRSALYLLCSSKSINLAEALARRVLHTTPADTEQDDHETIALLRQHTHQLRHELGARPPGRETRPLQLPR